MFLKVCHSCKYCRQRSDSSYCCKEGCYSYLTKCIQNKAIEMFIKSDAEVDFKPLKTAKATNYKV